MRVGIERFRPIRKILEARDKEDYFILEVHTLIVFIEVDNRVVNEKDKMKDLLVIKNFVSIENFHQTRPVDRKIVD